MAVTKIWAIHDSVSRVVEYCSNPDKTKLTDLEQVQKAYGDQYSFTTMNDSKRDVSNMLGEAAEMRNLWERQRRIQREKERQEKLSGRKPKNRDYER
jgi:hypothetical protein